MSCSLLIPTIKKSIRTLDSPLIKRHIEEVFVNKTKGISKARNELSRMATTGRFVFADDDITIHRTGWEFIEKLPLDMVGMLEGRNHPISRLMVVSRDVFKQIGGFDEVIKHNAEDLDFYWTCLEKGIEVQIIPGEFVDHEPHKEKDRVSNYFESAYVRVKHRKTDLKFFLRKNPVEAIMRIIGFIYYRFIFDKGKQ